jgi:hypothetical protein
MPYALQMDLSKGSIYTDHPPGIFLLWVNLPPLTLLKKKKKKPFHVISKLNGFGFLLLHILR